MIHRTSSSLRAQLRQQWIGVAIAVLALFVALNGPVVASDAVTSAKRLITGKQIKNRSVTAKDLSLKTVKALRGRTGPAGAAGAAGPQGSQGTAGAQGPAGPSGNDATPQEIVDKVVQADGAGSGIDADLLDGLDGSAFAPLANTVLDGDPADGDLTGSFPNNLQIDTGVVGQPEIATNGVGNAEITLNAVDTEEIASLAVTGAKVAEDTINGSDIAPNSIGTSELRNDAVTLDGTTSGGFTSAATVENLGAIAGDSCVYFSRTFAAAEPGELAIPRVSETAQTQTTLSDGLYFMPTMVTTDNVVPLTLCNYTAAPIDSPEFLLGYRLVAE